MVWNKQNGDCSLKITLLYHLFDTHISGTLSFPNKTLTPGLESRDQKNVTPRIQVEVKVQVGSTLGL